MNGARITGGAGAMIGIAALSGCALFGQAEPDAMRMVDRPNAYVLRVVEENGCRMSFDAFRARLMADGLLPVKAPARPGQPTETEIADANRVRAIEAAPAVLLDRGSLVRDSENPQIVVSRVGTCAP